jgi:glyoxylase-like metal-dependent hydrolase (beta-lactamase superfamily II)
VSKDPQPVLESIFAFPPNRKTLGGTAYLIVKTQGNILVDCPLWDVATQAFIEAQGGLQGVVITHRGGLSRDAIALYQAFNCPVYLQEQEAYLLPQVPVTPFQQGLSLAEGLELVWTPGHSPGSSCLYDKRFGGVLFTGRHLLPDQTGRPVPLKTEKTFHWPRQLASVEALRQRFTPATLQYICPGANTGLLRGRRVIEHAYEQLFKPVLIGNTTIFDQAGFP